MKTFLCQDCDKEFETVYCKKGNEAFPVCKECESTNVVRIHPGHKGTCAHRHCKKK